MKTPEYTEGPQATENFEKMATAIFKAPKPGGRKTEKSSKKAKEVCDSDHDKDEN